MYIKFRTLYTLSRTLLACVGLPLVRVFCRWWWWCYPGNREPRFGARFPYMQCTRCPVRWRTCPIMENLSTAYRARPPPRGCYTKNIENHEQTLQHMQVLQNHFLLLQDCILSFLYSIFGSAYAPLLLQRARRARSPESCFPPPLYHQHGRLRFLTPVLFSYFSYHPAVLSPYIRVRACVYAVRLLLMALQTRREASPSNTPCAPRRRIKMSNKRPSS